MCGRFTRLFTWEELHRLLSLQCPPPKEPLAPSYNIAPTQHAPVCVQDEAGRRIEGKRWGLIPHWAKDAGFGAKTMNARSETIASKPAFRDSFRRRRCLVPASGFYEWVSIEGQKKKQPLYIRPNDGSPFAMAGLYASWTDTETGEELDTFTICTTAPNALMEPIHNRMPCVLRAEDFDAWLDPRTEDVDHLKAMLSPREWSGFAVDPVTTRVNSPRENDAALVEPIEPGAASLFG